MAVTPSWLAWPTLSEANFGPEVAGTSLPRKELERIIERWGDLLTAELVIESKGAFAGAVRVLFDGEHVDLFLMDIPPTTDKWWRRFARGGPSCNVQSFS